MKLDMKALCENLRHAESEPTVRTDDCNEYLLHTVGDAILKDYDIPLDKIDYSKFDIEDISQLQEFCDRLWNASQRLKQLNGAVIATPPIAAKVRQFC